MDRKTAAIRSMRTVKFLFPAHTYFCNRHSTLHSHLLLRSHALLLSTGQTHRRTPDRFIDHDPAPQEASSVNKKGSKGSPYSIAERRVPDLIPVLSSQPVGGVSHKPGVRLPLQTVSVCMT